jgi:hypothetical protein
MALLFPRFACTQCAIGGNWSDERKRVALLTIVFILYKVLRCLHAGKHLVRVTTQSVEARCRKSMKKLMPHTPETDELSIVGLSMADQLLHQAQAPITLQQVLKKLQEHNSTEFALYCKLKAHKDKLAQKEAARRLQVRSLMLTHF